MSDFTSGFWSIYIIVVVVASLIGCCVLLLSSSKAKVVPPKGTQPSAPAGKGASAVGVTGHVWDGDLQEYNNPLPKWWMNLFWITIVFGAIYLVLYPGLGSLPGVLGWTSANAYVRERSEVDTALQPTYEKYAATDLRKLAADPAAHETGERLFLVNCAPCHGSNARGGIGFPNLTDNDWLYGGDPETIVTTITGGRMGIMPAFGAALGEEGVRNVVAYVRSFSGLPHDGIRAAQGKAIFAQNCAACHGAEGKGNQALGAPNLTDQIWLFGSSETQMIQGVTKGHNLAGGGVTPMPAFKDTLPAAQIRLLAAYVWGLSNQPAAARN
jgi:cytochrome c oxidase cbb3-type subunit 3